MECDVEREISAVIKKYDDLNFALDEGDCVWIIHFENRVREREMAEKKFSQAPSGACQHAGTNQLLMEA